MYKRMVKLSLKFLALGALTGGLWFYGSYGFPQAPSPLRVVVTQQPDCPLLILSTYVDSSNPLKPRYGYSLTNTSEKPVRAYTIQESVSIGPGAPIIYTMVAHYPAVKLFIKPHESRQEEGSEGSVYNRPPTEVALSVDFVEFADGTRWGDDRTKSAERLAGQRAGGKAAIRKCREILAHEGLKGLERALANPDLTEPENHPDPGVWTDGFKSGVAVVIHRLSAAKAKGGEDEVRRELEKPYDSTEGRQEP